MAAARPFYTSASRVFILHEDSKAEANSKVLFAFFCYVMFVYVCGICRPSSTDSKMRLWHVNQLGTQGVLECSDCKKSLQKTDLRTASDEQKNVFAWACTRAGQPATRMCLACTWRDVFLETYVMQKRSTADVEVGKTVLQSGYEHGRKAMGQTKEKLGRKFASADPC